MGEPQPRQEQVGVATRPTPQQVAILRVRSVAHLKEGDDEHPSCSPAAGTLRTTGRKSGKERTVPLNYVSDGKNLVAVCENFGLDKASSWPYNLLADPKARIEIEGTAADYLSRPATEEEVDRNMPRLIEMWPAHDTYVKRTGTRKVIVFEPVDAQT
jgi:deazaflavin-dependent oxidoreductase (nitroreductase family)